MCQTCYQAVTTVGFKSSRFEEWHLWTKKGRWNQMSSGYKMFIKTTKYLGLVIVFGGVLSFFWESESLTIRAEQALDLHYFQSRNTLNKPVPTYTSTEDWVLVDIIMDHLFYFFDPLIFILTQPDLNIQINISVGGVKHIDQECIGFQKPATLQIICMIKCCSHLSQSLSAESGHVTGFFVSMSAELR